MNDIKFFLDKECKKIQTALGKYSGPGMQNVDEITSNIYLSGYLGSRNIKLLRRKKIKNILSVSETRKTNEITRLYDKKKIKHFWIPLEDDLIQDIRNAVHESYDIIWKPVSNKKRILIHCNEGISRAPTIVCAYLLKRQYLYSISRQYKLRQLASPTHSILLKVLNFIKQSRNCIQPNRSFVFQLLVYEQQLKKLIQLPKEIDSSGSISSSESSSEYDTLEDVKNIEISE